MPHRITNFENRALAEWLRAVLAARRSRLCRRAARQGMAAIDWQSVRLERRV